MDAEVDRVLDAGLNQLHDLVVAGYAGGAATARTQYTELLAVRERVLGTEHPHTLTTRHNPAYWTGQSGNPAEARDLFAELLAVRERVLGADHPDTLTTRRHLAHWTQQARRATDDSHR